MVNLDLRCARLIAVDDEVMNLRLLEAMLRSAGYEHIRCIADPRDAMSAVEAEMPDLVLLDLHMPHITGFDLIAMMRARAPKGDFLPIVVLTADTAQNVRRLALEAGAADFLTKPFDRIETLLRVRNLLNTRLLHMELQRHYEMLRSRADDLEATQLEMLDRLARVGEYRDDDSGDHTRRVGELSGRLALEMGLEPNEADMIHMAARLHDLGKTAVPDGILHKPGRVTPEEFEIIKTHAPIGGDILSGSASRLLQLAEEIALTHHERWDGSGYPQRLKGEEIPISGRIVAVADVFDALTHERPYKPAWPVEEARAEIVRTRGTCFDPRVVDALEALFAVHAEELYALPLAA